MSRPRPRPPTRLAVAAVLAAVVCAAAAGPASAASSTASTGLSTATSTGIPAATAVRGADPAATAAGESQVTAAVALEGFSGIASPGRPLDLTGRVTTSAPVTDLSVRVEVGQPVTSRAGLAEVRQAPAGITYSPQLNTLTPVHGGAFSVTAPLRSSRSALTIYPMRVAAVGRAAPGEAVRVLGATYTFLVWAPPRAGAATTEITTVLPLSDRPRLRSDGLLTDNALEAEVAPGGRLRDLLDAVTQGGVKASAVALALDPSMLKALMVMTGSAGYDYASATGRRHADPSQPAATFLKDLRAFADTSGNTVFALPWGDADLTALLRAGQGNDALDAVNTGRTVVAEALGRGTPDGDVPAAYPADGLADAATLQFLAGAGRTTVILDDRLLPMSASSPVKTPTALTVQKTASGPVRALAADSRLSEIVTAPEAGKTGPTQAQVLGDALAELAMMSTQPGQSRLSVLALPRLWNPPAGWAKRVLGLLGAADSAQAADHLAFFTPAGLAPVAAGDTGSGADPALTTPAGTSRSALVYPDWARAQEIPTSYVNAVEHLRTEASGLDAALCARKTTDDRTENPAGACALSSEFSTPDDPVPDGRKYVVKAMRDTLLTALSVWWRANRAGAVSLSQEVDGRIQKIRGQVQIFASSKVTLTSRHGTVPLTVQNVGDPGGDAHPMTVVLSLSSNDKTRLQSSARKVVTVRPGDKQQIEIEVSLDSAGTFPVYVQVLGPDNTRLSNTPARILVRSTAYGAIATTITFAAIALFAAAVILRQVRRARRRHRGEDDPVDPANALVESPPGETSATGSSPRTTGPVRRIQANAAGTQRIEGERAYAGGVPANPSEP